MKTKRRTAIYLRVSDEGETQSLNEQEPIIREDLEVAGDREHLDFEVLFVLKEDAGQKGWNEKRSEFNSLKRYNVPHFMCTTSCSSLKEIIYDSRSYGYASALDRKKEGRDCS